MRLSITTAYRAIAIVLVAALTTGVAYAAPASVTSTTTVPPVTPKPKPKPKPAPSVIPQPNNAATEAFRAELERRQAALQELKTQLDQLDRELEIAAESYNAASEALAGTQDQLRATRSDLGSAQDALDEQSQLLEKRLDAMYRDGELSTAEILLAAKSIPDFFQRLQFITTISSADAGLAKQLAGQRDQIAGTEIDLQKSDMQAQALEFTLRARKMEIEYRIAEREALLKSSEKDLLALLDDEAKKRVADEMGVWRSILRGASDIGVSVDPGSPVETALSYHGIPYLWGGTTPNGFDCSGLMQYVYKQHGVTTPRVSRDQFRAGIHVEPDQMQPGDLVFFGSPVYHVGMYIGGGYFVHAPRTGDYVKVSPLAKRTDFVGARRFPWRYRVGPPLGVSTVSLPGNLPGR
ncbi:MAG: NlpC/P60 family protein [Coriobacteriia bacterium]|nr:NlpC/P60 family protein [Coriobacteriia bacterium]